MNEQILRCCDNSPNFLIRYRIGSKFYVCTDCLSKEIWNRGIETKEILS